MYISLLLKMRNGFSWKAKIMVSPFNASFLKQNVWDAQKGIEINVDQVIPELKHARSITQDLFVLRPQKL